jgi:hypothetical protein
MAKATGRRLSKGSVVALAACLVLGTVAANASGEALKKRSATVTVPTSEDAVATAKCKQGEKAISGGFEAPEFDFSEEVVPYASRKQGARGWRVAAANWSNEFSHPLTAYVYCREGKKLTTAQAETEIPFSESPGSATASAKCDRGEKVVSGGYEIPDYELVAGDFRVEGYAYSSRKTGGREWSAAGIEYSQEAITIRAYVYCREKGGVKTKSASATFGDLGTATAKCKKGHRVLSGGFHNAEEGPTASNVEVIPFASMKLGGRRWTGSAFNEGLPEDGTHTVYAYCEKKGRK